MLTLKDVAHFPRPGMVVPGAIRFTPEGRLTFLWSASGGLERTLWELDPETGERREIVRPPEEPKGLSRDEELRRERARMRATGVTGYAWADKAPVMIVPIRGDVYRYPGMERIVQDSIDPKLTPDGRTVVFLRGRNLWAGETQLTRGYELFNGFAEYNAQEEFGRSSGYWISPDSRTIAFQETDDRQVPVYPIVHQGKHKLEIEEHRYPFAGGPNVKWRLGRVPIEGGTVEWMNFEDEYLARVDWAPDGRLFVQTLNRDQTRLTLTCDGKEVFVEESEPWLNLHRDLRFLEDGRFLWASERTGFKHLYLHDGGLKPLTSGDWPVDAVFRVVGDQVWFAAGRESPLERQIFRVSLDGTIEQVSKKPGTHDAVVSKEGRWVDIHSSVTQPPRITLGERVIHESKADLPAPELMSFKSRDGERLHAMVYRPAKTPAPLVVSVYGGPHAQRVRNFWDATVDLRCQYLAQEGFTVLKVDNRGSARRGLRFEGAIHLNMGDIEVRDQVDGVRWAQAQGLATDRVGVFGGSYGGYMTLMCLCRAPEVFHAGVASASVTHWDGYDSGYTERYMSTPEKNPEGYRVSSVMAHVENLRGRLLLIHGMIDENVHFRHTARLVNALNRAGKEFELMAYPDERHMPRGEADRLSMETRITRFFEKALR